MGNTTQDVGRTQGSTAGVAGASTAADTSTADGSAASGQSAEANAAGARADSILARYATMVPGTSIVASLDEEGLARELATVIGEPALVREVFGKLSYSDTDDVAYYLVHGLADAQLVAVDASLLEYLKTQLEGGVCTPSELTEVGRIGTALGGASAGTPAAGAGAGASAPRVEYHVVSDADARIRTPPTELKSTAEKIPQGTKVTIIESTTKGRSQYSNVQDLAPSAEGGEAKVWGWTSSGNLTDGQIYENVDKYATAEGTGQVAGQTNANGKNTSALSKAKDTGNAFTPSEVHSQLGDLEGQAFVDGADAETGKKTWTEDQQGLIQSAKDFASSPKTLTSAQQANATITWSNLSLDGITLNASLKSRLELFQKFIAWANIVTGPTKNASAMRSPQNAHKMSTAWMYSAVNTGSSSKLTTAANRRKLADNLIAQNGVDKDANTWASATTVSALKDAGQDDQKIVDLLPTLRADAAQVQTQDKQAAEGYTEADKRKPNILAGSGVSNHLKGLAVDAFPMWIFPNLFDPMIDAIAMYFGLYRACKDLSTPEHWHFELLGTPPAPTQAEAAE